MKDNIDYSKLTIEEVAQLSDHHRHRYEIWAAGKNKKKEVKDNFAEYLNHSCDQYIFYR